MSSLMDDSVQHWPILHCWTGDHVDVTVKDKHDGWRIPSADLSNAKYAEDRLGTQQDSWLIPADTCEAAIWKDGDETVSELNSLAASPDISSFGDEGRFEEPLLVHETTLSRLQLPRGHDIRKQTRGSKDNGTRGPAASAPALMTSAAASVHHDSVQSQSSSHSHSMHFEKAHSTSLSNVFPQRSAAHTYRADAAGSPFKRARVPAASERSSVDSFAKDALQVPTLICVPVSSGDDSTRGAMTKFTTGSATAGAGSTGPEESADASSQPSGVLASLDAHLQMLEMDCETLSRIFVGPAMATRAWQSIKEEAFLPSVTKAMRRGRQPAADPRLQPDITPRRAARILANRASAARSKEKHRLALAHAKASMKCAAFKVEACTREMELLTKAIEKFECENSTLEQTVEAMRHELKSLESLEMKLLRQAADRLQREDTR